MVYVKPDELRLLWEQCRRRWWLFALSLCGCMTLAIAFIFVKNKKHEVYTTINLSDSDRGGLMAEVAKSSGFGDILGMGGTEIDNEVVILGSHHVIRNAVKEIGMHIEYTNRPKVRRRIYWKDCPIELAPVDPGYCDTLGVGLSWKLWISPDGRSADIYCKNSLGDVVCDLEDVALPARFQTLWGEFTLRATEHFETGEKLFMKASIHSYTYVAQHLMNAIDIDLVDKKANVVMLKYKDINPARTVDLLNAIIHQYEVYTIGAKDENTRICMEFLQQHIDTVARQLDDLEAQIVTYKTDNKVANVELETNLAIEKAKALQDQMINYSLMRYNFEQIEQYVSNPANQYAPIPLSATGTSGAASAYNTVLEEFLIARRGAQPGNPAYDIALQTLEDSRSTLLATMKASKASMEHAAAEVRRQLDQMTGMVGEVPEKEREYRDLLRQQELKQRIYVMLLAQQEQNAVTLSQDTPKGQRLDEAYVSVLPTGISPLAVLLGALFMALFMPLAWIKATDMLKPTLSRPNEVDTLEGMTADLHVIKLGDEADLRSLVKALHAIGQGGPVGIVDMAGEAEAETLAAQLKATVDAHPMLPFTHSTDALYDLPGYAAQLVVVVQDVTAKAHLTYIESLFHRGALPHAVVAYIIP